MAAARGKRGSGIRGLRRAAYGALLAGAEAGTAEMIAPHLPTRLTNAESNSAGAWPNSVVCSDRFSVVSKALRSDATHSSAPDESTSEQVSATTARVRPS